MSFNKFTFVQVIKACTNLEALEDGRLGRERLIQVGVSLMSVKISLVDMYAKCWSIEDVRKVFNKMPSQNVVAWTTMILGHVLKWG